MPTKKPKVTAVFDEDTYRLFLNRVEELGISKSEYLRVLIRNDCAVGGPLTTTFRVRAPKQVDNTTE